MTTVLNESQVLAKTRCQDLYSVFKINFWGSGIKDVSLVRKLTNVEVIGLSSNEITTLEDFSYCTKLKELIVPKNKIESIAEVAHLQKLPKLTNLWLGDNPCAENTYNYRKVVLKALPNLTMLDNIPVTPEELQEIERLGNDIYEEVPYESYDSSSNSGPNSNNTIPDNNAPNGNGQANYQSNQQLNQKDEFSRDDFVAATPTSAQQQIRQDALNHDISVNYDLNDSRNFSMSGRHSQRPQSRASMQAQFQHCRSLNSDFGMNNGPNHGGCSMNNLNTSQCNNNNNNNNISQKGGRAGQSNIVSAMLCLIKELDYSSCEVVRTALRIHMEETSQ